MQRHGFKGLFQLIQGTIRSRRLKCEKATWAEGTNEAREIAWNLCGHEDDFFYRKITGTEDWSD